jgi:uncharacterized protein (TIGR00251 family)
VKLIQVKVKPNARHSVLTAAGAGIWRAELRSGPVDGKANRELISLVAAHFGCLKSAVAIKSGASGRMKWLTIDINDAGTSRPVAANPANCRK